ncbi:hypothetical protein BGZ65_007073, partial [Modicella reniformis]
MSTNLDVISENAMVEDLLDTNSTAHALLEATSTHLIPPTANHNDHDHDHDHDDDGDSSGSNNSDTADSDNDNSGEDDDDQAASDDSDDEDLDPTIDKESRSSQEASGSKDRSNRSRTSAVSKKKRPSIGSLSTSPSSNLARIVSATPTKKIAKKTKKTIKSKSSKGSLSSIAARQVSEEAKLEGAKPIVSRFLELENTKLNDKLLQVFMINGMVPYVIESITRLDSEIAKELSNDMEEDTNQESRFMKHTEQCHRTRDYSNLDLMKKSYTAMNVLIRNDVYNEFVLSSAHQSIVKELFKIFRPESNGNFYHFQKVFETILKKFRPQIMATLFEDVDSESGLAKVPMIFDMLPFLDQGPVALSMIRILFPTYTYAIADKIPAYYQILQNGHFMEMLLAMVTLPK